MIGQKISTWMTLTGDFLLAPFQYSDRRLPKRVEAVWVLSGPELTVSGSNKQRISKGLELAKKLRANYFIFNGVPQQNRHLTSFLTRQKGWPFRVVVFDSSKERRGNTRQQVQTFASRKKLAALQSMVIVSSMAHLPRVKRYLSLFRTLKAKTYLVGVGSLLDRELTIISEWKKLIHYSQTGDLSL